MSYLMLSAPVDDNAKGIISLWFRFSADAVAAAAAYRESYQQPDYGDFALGPEIFNGTIPLVTFGRKTMAHIYGFTAHLWEQETVGGTLTALTFDPVPKEDAPCEPSHIGLLPGSDGITLKVVFQLETQAEAQGLYHHTTDIHWEVAGDLGLYQKYTTIEDASYVKTGQPAVFRIEPKFSVDPDQWHHLLLSFDFSGGVDVVAVSPAIGGDEGDDLTATVKTYCKIWYALDDQNKKGKENIGDGWVPQDENGVVCDVAKQAAISYTPFPPDPFVTGGDENREYHWAASPLPIRAGPMGLPATAEYVETIYHIELSEFQMWTGITLDTGVESNRRAFIDFERDKDGNIILDKDGKKTLKPVPPNAAEELLGKKPEILLHGSSKWINGKNTGSAGVNYNTDPPTEKPDGQFKVISEIWPYKPDPSRKA